MKTVNLLFVALMFLSCSACNKDQSDPILDPTQIKLSEKAAEVIHKSNDFGIDLFKAVAVEDSDVNLMISPLSASAALTMLMNGCDNETYEQIHEMLGYQGLSTNEINDAYNSLVNQLLAADATTQLALANALWYRNGFNVFPSYLETMNKAFDAHIEGLDFSSPSSLQTMNQWASDNTQGKIPKVLDEISLDAVMFLMNALYFKGVWTEQFKTENTYNSPFFLEDGSTANVPTMHGTIQANVIPAEGFKALELFYGRKNFSMVILLPDGGLSDFMEGLTPDIWEETTNALDAQSYHSDVFISLPKYSFEYEKTLNDQLKALGITDVFIADLADLSKISDEDLFVSFVKQNTFVEVNEEGTEAAAVTTIGIETTSIGNNSEFIVDKPFIFAIREQTTNTLLFIGQVMNPE